MRKRNSLVWVLPPKMGHDHPTETNAPLVWNIYNSRKKVMLQKNHKLAKRLVSIIQRDFAIWETKDDSNPQISHKFYPQLFKHTMLLLGLPCAGGCCTDVGCWNGDWIGLIPGIIGNNPGVIPGIWDPCWLPGTSSGFSVSSSFLTGWVATANERRFDYWTFMAIKTCLRNQTRKTKKCVFFLKLVWHRGHKQIWQDDVPSKILKGSLKLSVGGNPCWK